MTAPRAVLLVDDHDATRETITEVLEDAGHRVWGAENRVRALELLESRPFDLVLTDLKLPDGSGMAVMSASRRASPRTPVIMVTGHATIENAIEATRLGAYEYLPKPVDLNKLRVIVANALHLGDLERRVEHASALDAIIGHGPRIAAVKDLVRQVAATDATVLVQGESGTGKELVANALQALSRRAGGPYVRVNVAALAREVIESELFGHEKGAFTGAIRLRKGRFELAAGGTLFLDEIGEMPPETQVKLLRVLQAREFERVGGVETLPTDVRLICATNRDLRARVAEGRFREDLYFRVNVIRIPVPALRERMEDLPLLAEHFRQKFCARYDADRRFAPDVLPALAAYDWPGNVRELENAIEGAVVRSTGAAIEAAALPDEVRECLPAGDAALPAGAPDGAAAMDGAAVGAPGAYPPGLALAEVERRYLLAELERCQGNKTQAAKRLGIGLKTLYRKLEEYGTAP